MALRPTTAAASTPGTPPARPESVLREAVDTCRSRLTRRMLLARLLIILALIVLFPLVVVAADHLWSGGLPPGVRQTVLTVWGVGVIAALLGTVLVTLLRRISPLFIGRYLEQVHGIRHNTVVNALLLRRAGQAHYAEDAAVRQAVRDLAGPGPSGEAEPSSGRLSGLLLLATLAVWVLYLVSSAKPVGPSLARFFGADVPAPTATWLELVRPGPEDVAHVGEPLEIEIAVHGRSVSDVVFEILDPTRQDEPLRQYALSESIGAGVDRRQLVLAPFVVTGNLHFRCRAGDGRLDGVIPVQPQPDIEHLAIELTPPAYTGWPARRNVTPELSVLAGTRATFALTANGDIADPVFVLFDGRRETRTRMTVRPDRPQVARLSLTLTQSGSYHVEFSDRWGYEFRDPPHHSLTVRADQTPRVRITTPAAEETDDGVADIQKLAEVVVLAEDDIGIATLTFHYHPVGGTETEPLILPVGDAADRERVTGRVRTAELPLLPGMAAEVWFQTQDGCVVPSGRPAPQSATSSRLTLVWPVGEPSRKRRPAASDKSDENQDVEPRAEESEEPADEGDCEDEGAGGDEGEEQARGQGEAESPGDATGERERGSDGKPDEGSDRESEGPFDGNEGGDAEGRDGVTDREDTSEERGFGEELDDFVKRHGEKAREVLCGPRDSEDPGTDSEADSPTDQGQHQDTAEQDTADAPKSKSGECSGDRTGDSSTGKTDQAVDQDTPDGKGDNAADAADSPADRPSGRSNDGPADSHGGGGEPGADESGGGDDTGRPDAADSSTADGRPQADMPHDATGRAETLELLEMLERGEEITEDMLKEAGWSAPEAAAFVRDLRALHAAAQRAGSVGAGRFVFDARVGDAERRTSGGMSADVAREADALQRREDGLRRITPPAEQKVPAPLQELLDAYYRALAAQRTGE